MLLVSFVQVLLMGVSVEVAQIHEGQENVVERVKGILGLQVVLSVVLDDGSTVGDPVKGRLGDGDEAAPVVRLDEGVEFVEEVLELAILHRVTAKIYRYREELRRG